MYNKKTFKTAALMSLGTIAMSSLLAVNEANGDFSASAAATQYKVAKNGYVYKNAKIKAVKSKSEKKYFGNATLTVKKTVVVKKHGKKLVYKYVVASNGKSGYVYVGSLKKATAKLVKATSSKKVGKKDPSKEPNAKQRKKNLKDLYTFLGMGSDGSDDSGSSANAKSLNSLSDSQIASQVKSEFIKFVQQQRAQAGKSPWVENAKLDAVAQKRASYVNPDAGTDSHYLTADGVYHSYGAAQADAKSLGYSMNDLYESNGDFTQDGVYGTISGISDSTQDFITNDAASNYGHRNQLLGIKGRNGLNNFGIGVRVDRNSSNGSVTVTMVILSSDTNY